MTQLDVADEFATRHAGGLAYCHGPGRDDLGWYGKSRDATGWRKLRVGEALHALRLLVEDLSAFAGNCEGMQRRDFIDAVERVCRADPRLACFLWNEVDSSNPADPWPREWLVFSGRRSVRELVE